MTPPIIKCPAGYAYGYVPIDSGGEIAELDDDGIFEAATDIPLAVKKNPRR